jgi:hypothetical protein
VKFTRNSIYIRNIRKVYFILVFIILRYGQDIARLPMGIELAILGSAAKPLREMNVVYEYFLGKSSNEENFYTRITSDFNTNFVNFLQTNVNLLITRDSCEKFLFVYYT